MSDELQLEAITDADIERINECAYYVLAQKVYEPYPRVHIAPEELLGLVTEIERLRAEMERRDATLDAITALHKEIVEGLCREHRETQAELREREMELDRPLGEMTADDYRTLLEFRDRECLSAVNAAVRDLRVCEAERDRLAALVEMATVFEIPYGDGHVEIKQIGDRADSAWIVIDRSQRLRAHETLWNGDTLYYPSREAAFAAWEKAAKKATQ